jgi:hypothetical protein
VYLTYEKVTRLDRHLILKNARHPSPSSFKRDWTHARRKAGLLHDINHKNHLDFHDIKKKAITDFEAGNDDERLLYSAHKSKQQMNDYNLKINPDRRPAGNHDLGLD